MSKNCKCLVVNVHGRLTDPTKTLTIRNMFAAKMQKEFNLLKYAVRDKMLEFTPPIVTNVKYDWTLIPEKVEEFLDWLREQEAAGILALTRTAVSEAESWWGATYLQTAYNRGIKNAQSALKKQGYPVPGPVLGTPTPFAVDPIQVAFNSPHHVNKVGYVYSRAYESLKGITAEMNTVISKVLAQGMSNGDSPKVIARKLYAAIDGSGAGTLAIKDSLNRKIDPKRRAIMLARSEVIRAHHLATIEEYRAYGVEGVDVIAELHTAGDTKVCPICKKLEGRTYTLDEAEGIIPVHPFCRCMMQPVPFKKKDIIQRTFEQ